MCAYDHMEGLVRAEDLQEMQRRLNQEELLIRHRFEPVLPEGRELFVRDLELFTRGRALVEALQVLTADEGATRERS